MTHSTKTSLAPPLWKLILLCSIASFCALLPADAGPLIAHYFQISAHSVEGVISWFLLGYGLGPLIYAPIANRYGRKKALFIGFAIALIGMLVSLLGIPTHEFATLLIGRFIAGVGSSAGLVIGMVIINETTEPAQARRLFSLIVLFFAFAPAIAMACGGSLSVHLGFASLFLLMPILICGLIVLVCSLKETYLGEPIPIEVKKTTLLYSAVLKQRTFVLLALIMTMATAVMYVFNGISPLVAIDQLKISPATYGDLAIIPSLGLFVGALISAYMSKRHTAIKTAYVGLGAMIIGAVIMSLAFFMSALNLVTLLAPSFLLFLGAAIVIPNASMTAIATAKDPAIASSVMNSTALILSSLVVTVSGYFLDMGAVVLPVVLLILSLLGLLLLKLAKQRTNNMES